MRVSFIVPAYNEESTIAEVLERVEALGFDSQIVVVDDGSTDGGAEIVRSMTDARIRLFEQPNAGVSSARNKGIKEARYELIAFLDADDNYNPDFLAVILDLAAKYETAGAYGTSFEITTENLKKVVSRTSSLRDTGAKDVLIHDFFRDALSGWVIWTSATAVPKKTFDEVGLFTQGVRLGQDWDMWIRIGAKFPIAVSSYIGSNYHLEATNRTDVGKIRGIEFELVKTGLRLLSSAPLGAEQRTHLREFISKFQIITARQWIMLGQRDRARKLLLECRTTRFIVSKAWWLLWTLIPTPVTVGAEKIYRIYQTYSVYGSWRRRLALVPAASATEEARPTPRTVSPEAIQRFGVKAG